MAALPLRSPPPPKPPAMAGTPAERADVLVSVMDRLAGLLARELEAMRARRYGEIIALQGEKRDLTKRLDEIGRLVRLDRAGLAALSRDLLVRLKAAGQQLAMVTLASAETLTIQAEAQKWVVEVAVKSSNQQRRADTAYGQLQRGFVPRAVRPGVVAPTTFSATL